MRRDACDDFPLQHGRDAPVDPALTREALWLVRASVVAFLAGLTSSVSSVVAFVASTEAHRALSDRQCALLIAASLVACAAAALRTSRGQANAARRLSGLTLPDLP